MITDPRMTANTDPKTIVNTDPRIAIIDLEIETEDLVLAVGIDIPEAEGRLRQDAQDWELDAAEHLLPVRRRAQPHLRPPPLQLDVLAQGELPGI